MKCLSCGSEASGRFCSSCGAGLSSAACPKCGQESPAGARFCNGCGTAIPGAGGAPDAGGTGTGGTGPGGTGPGGSVFQKGPANQAVWYMAGALMVGLILVVAYPVYGPGRASPGPPPAVAPTGVSSVDLSSMTPREAADRLFNRVMTASAAGNDTEMVNFLPMAIRAHEIVQDLDADGKFHLVILNLQGLLYADALVAAEDILAEQPEHLFGLAGAADASLALGDSASARAFYQRWLDAYDSEMAKDLSEYRDHSQLLPTQRATAQALLGND